MGAEARDYYQEKVWDVSSGMPESFVDGDLSKPFRLNVARVLDETGIDLANAKIKKLEGDIAGLYNTADKGISLDESILLFEHLKQFHVLLHEAHHKRFDLSRNGERIDSDFEEGLNELLCKRSTGITLAYNEEQQMVRDVARANNTFTGNLVEMFKQGHSNELNDVWSVYQSRLAS